MTVRSTLYNIFFHYSQFSFVTISMTLATGVLGLPTTLANSGFAPFLITIFASYIAQILTVIFFTAALQKAYYRAVDEFIEIKTEKIPIQSESNEPLTTYGSQDDVTSTAKLSDNFKPIQRYLPNWHSLGNTYLPYFLPYLCTLNMLAITAVFLISYILAASQAFIILTGGSFYKIAAIFGWILISIILVFDPIISPIISVLTIFKGIIFTIIIIITFVVSLQHTIPSKTDFTYTGDSLLMSLVSLVGIAGVLPLMFRRVKQTKTGIIGFHISIFLALTTSVILYILWCWSILAIVPQHSVCLPNNNTEITQRSSHLFTTTQVPCVQSPSLEEASEAGQIAPVPLTLILTHEQSPVSHYIGTIIQVFVTISVSVSFLTTGSVLYQTLTGVIDTFWSSPHAYETQYGGFFKHITVQTLRQWFLALLLFSIIFTIALINPKGFNVFIQQVAALLVCIQYGLFQVIMSHKASYSSDFHSYELSLQLPQWFLPFQYLVPVYYICCGAYSLYTSVVLLIKN